MKYTRQNGVTLIELMVTIAIAVIVMAIAAPAYIEFVAGQKIRTASGNLHSDFLRSRNESISRNINIYLKPITSSDWSDGWKICTEIACDTVISEETQTDTAMSIDAGNVTEVIFMPNGRVRNSASFEFTHPKYSGSTRCAKVSVSGLPLLEKKPC